ncbi:MAG TPA: phage tail protein [Pseudonocardiaceae bacterium]|nr:phage tail protein [Pseudonocardiaceae bacterium]
MVNFISPQMVSPTLIGQAVGALENVPTTSQADYPKYALAMRFAVEVDAITSLGNWSTCKGLKVEFKATSIAQGGNYVSTKLLPDCLEYSRITLERGMRQPDSQRVKDWLIKVKQQWITPGKSYSGCSATIRLLSPANPKVDLMKWDLVDVFPVSWSGPDMAADRNAVAIESLTLQHGGFL